MKKVFLSLAVLFACAGVYAREYSIRVDSTSVPAAAQEILVQRFAQMLEAGGHTVGEDGIEIFVSGEVLDRMETAGSMSQTALSVVITAQCGDVKAEFPLKGVGEDEADAWVRAAKRFLPRSQEARAFVERL